MHSFFSFANTTQGLTDVGDFEYWKIRPVLSRITSPEQLHQIELASPQIRGEDAELWKSFIARDIPDWKRKNYVPKNPLKWYEVYMRYRKEQREEIERDKERLMQAMAGIMKEKETHVSKVVDAKHLPKLPRDPRMLSNDGGVPISGRKKAFSKPGSSTLNFSAGSKSRIKDPASVLIRARREAKEISSRNKLGMPTHNLKATSSRVLRAPAAMVDDHRRAAASQLRIFTPRKKSDSIKNAPASVNGLSLEERERRLKALKLPSCDTGVTFVGSDSDNDEPDDHFGDRTATSGSSSINKPHSRKGMPQSTSPRGSQDSQPFSKSKEGLAKASPEAKPSDVISSIISKPRLKPTYQGHSSSQPKTSPLPSNTSATGVYTTSPMKSTTLKSPLTTKRKPEVDIFNRSEAAAKRPRVR